MEEPTRALDRARAAAEDAGADPEDREREAVEAAAAARKLGDLGRPGTPMDKRSPFFIGMTGAAGVAVTIGVVELLLKARSVLILVIVALFIAAGLDPVVRWLARKGLPRRTARSRSCLGGLGTGPCTRS